ncbi:hypothetical protein T484DRAFT_1755861 [Baffinella frigidus]|nr:hypothetical protein T484DRAFT_1755861 [Cryptophyta sp. CCMP2293]
MSLSTNANQLTDATSVAAPPDSMTKYTAIVHTPDDLVILEDFDECLELLQSELYRRKAQCERGALIASLRVEKFKELFDSAKDDPAHQCNCSADDKTWCMHPGHFDHVRVANRHLEHDHCLFCNVFFTNKTHGGGCVHSMLHADCLLLSSVASVPSVNGLYAHRLSSFLARDEKQKAGEDAIAKGIGKRKAALVFERMKRKGDAWMQSCKMSPAQVAAHWALVRHMGAVRRGEV